MNTDTARLIGAQLAGMQSSRLETQLQEHRERLDRIAMRNAEYQTEITQGLRTMRETGQLIDLIQQQNAGDNYGAHLVDEWNALCEHPRLADATLQRGLLVLTTTDDIYLHSPDRPDTRWLGAFEITIGLSNGAIRLRNLNTRRGGRDHPHVVGGTPCFGSNGPAFAQLQANGDLYPLFELILQYLETINLEDEYGRFGAYWFDQEDARPEDAAEAITYEPYYLANGEVRA